MNWQQMSAYRMESAEGYLISQAKHGDGCIYVARAPRIVGYVYSGRSLDEAQAACDAHLVRLAGQGLTRMVEVPVCDLGRPALNWLLASRSGLEVEIVAGVDGKPACMLGDHREGRLYDPAGDWEQGGSLLDEWSVFDTDLVAACRAVVVKQRGCSPVHVPAVLVGVAGE